MRCRYVIPTVQRLRQEDQILQPKQFSDNLCQNFKWECRGQEGSRDATQCKEPWVQPPVQSQKNKKKKKKGLL